MLLCFDDRYAIRDLYFPHVGLYNHLSGHSIRMGIWLDDSFSWCDSPDWQVHLDYQMPSMAGLAVLTNNELGCVLECIDHVDVDTAIYYREVNIRSRALNRSEVRLFFTHDLRIDESDIGDTAFFHPESDSLIHYKRHRYFVFRGESETNGIFEYATGIKAFGHLVGTWIDAEDGALSGNPIAQGSVDSTFSLASAFTNDSARFCYGFGCGTSLQEVIEIAANLTQRHCEISRAKRTQLSLESNRILESRLDELPANVRKLCERSLSIIETQIDHTGAIIAATDSDILLTNRATYCSMWPRDGALVSMLMMSLGKVDVAERFVHFCFSVFDKRSPFLWQKYSPDGSVGASWHPWVRNGLPSLPIQQDETALFLIAFSELMDRNDRAGEHSHYWSAAEAMLEFLLAYRDPESKLPLASFDLWEERFGVHAFTTVQVTLALRKCGALAEKCSRNGEVWLRAAEEMEQAFHSVFYEESIGRYVRSVTRTQTGYEADLTPDASLLNIMASEFFSPTDERRKATMEQTAKALQVATEVGGIARYQGDYYFRESASHPGNPWIITTMWLAQCQILSAESIDDLSIPCKWLNWAVDHAASTGVLPEQLHPTTGAHLSVSPLTWSHAEFVKTALMYTEMTRTLRKQQPLQEERS